MTAAQVAQAVRMKAEDMPITEIAAVLGVGRMSVTRALARMTN
jgi:DNA-directed RNA polymerase specialized sigma subunit